MTRRLITQDKKVVRLKEVKMQIGRKINKSGLLQHRELLAAAQRFEYKNLFVFNKQKVASVYSEKKLNGDKKIR